MSKLVEKKENNEVEGVSPEEDSENFYGERVAAEFICPECKKINRDEVIFNCNYCESEELIHKGGMYICPQCFKPGENFECMLCGSKKVTVLFME